MISNKISRTDYVVLTTYIGCWLLLLCAYATSITSDYFVRSGMLLVGICAPIFLYAWYFRRLRITAVVLLWFLVGIIQVCMMFLVMGNHDFDSINGSYASVLVCLPSMLISFSLMRLLYWLFYKDELVITAPGNGHENGRKLRFMDYILSVAGATLFNLAPFLT